MYPETRGVPLEEMDRLFGDEVAEDDDDDGEDDEDDDSGSETASILAGNESRGGSYLPTSRKNSSRSASRSRPSSGVLGRMGGWLGMHKTEGRGGYDTVDGDQ